MPTYLKYEYIFLHFDLRSDPDTHFFQPEPDPHFSQPDPDPWKKKSDPHP